MNNDKFDYKFVCLEKIITEHEFEVSCSVLVSEANNLGRNGYELINIVIIEGVQYGWFKKRLIEEKDEEENKLKYL